MKLNSNKVNGLKCFKKGYLNMKIGVAGAGAVGSVFGGLLSNAGYEVVFMARGEHLKAMKEFGLILEGRKETYKINKEFIAEPSGFSDVDVILFCFKSNDTRERALELKRVIKPETVIVTLQNGVDNEEVLSEIFGKERVISAASYVQAKVSSPGNVKQEGRIKLEIGELHENSYNSCANIVEMFRESKIDIKHVDNIMEHKWKKLLWNVTFNPLSATMQVRVGEILEDSNLYEIANNVCIESIRVAKKLGIPLDAEKTLTTIFDNATYAREHQTSMLQDRIQNKKMEVESMCGFIVKKGEEQNVSTPTLTTIYNMLTFINKEINPIQK